MPNIFNILGYLKINNEEDAIKYLMNEIDIPRDDHYDILRDELDPVYDNIKTIGEFSYEEDKYTGKQFDRLTVLGRDINKHGSNPYYVCKCSCGNIKSIFIGSLLSNRSRSCGCIRKELATEKGYQSVRDLTGQYFGLLKVIRPDRSKSSRHGIYWICECECGNSTSVQSSHLINGDVKSCGCLLKHDLTGRKFGKLTVKYLDEEKSVQLRESVWICECECGETKSIRANSLLTGMTTSCGCNVSHNMYDLTSKEYGIGYTKNGSIFLFDKEDYPIISKYMWTVGLGGYIRGHLRDCSAANKSNQKYVLMHRLVMGITDPNVLIDHIYHNVADNRKSQLRVATRDENRYNMQLSKSNTSGRTGVYYNKNRHKWIAQLSINGSKIHLGSFDTPEEAANARLQGEKKYFGNFRYQGSTKIDQILDDYALDKDNLIHIKS